VVDRVAGGGLDRVADRVAEVEDVAQAAVALVDGGVKVKGTIFSTLSDQKKNKTILNASIPVDADVKVGDIVIPVPNIK